MRMINETQQEKTKYAGQRNKLVKLLKNKGITSTKVLEAIEHVPRHWFFMKDIIDYAYQDNAYPISCDQTISQPYTVASQTELLDIEEGHKVLEIGTGSGYQAAILYSMGAKVYTIERHKALFKEVVELYKHLSIKVNCFLGDGSKGLAKYAPYDRILVTAAAPSIPLNLIDQLSANGKMVVPVGSHKIQEMKLIVKNVDNQISISKNGNFKFVPLIGEQGFKK